MKQTEVNSDYADELLLKIRQGNEDFLKKLYEDYRRRFIRWFQKNHRIDESEAIEIYQRAFTIFYFNVKDEKIMTLNSTVSTYLFGIGKNLAREKFRKQKDIDPLDAVPDQALAYDDWHEKEETSHMQTLVNKILDKLEEPCKSILLMYYFKNFSMESIAINLGYKNEGVAKKTKCLCLKKIREQLADAKIEL